MKVIVACSIDASALETIRERHDVIDVSETPTDLRSAIRDRNALVVRSGVQITGDLLRCAPEMELVIRAGSGIDNIDLEYLAQMNIRLERIPGPGALAVAEMTFALMLSLARNVLPADRLWRAGHWVKSEMTGHQVSGKTLGIIGLGNIGMEVARLGSAWSMQVIGCIDRWTLERAAHFATVGVELLRCDDVLARADFVTLHVPLLDSTRMLLSDAALAKMKPTAFLINMARGGVVHEAALAHALTEGRIAGAALDVHESEGEGRISPLAHMENVILTPHIGAGTFDAQRAIGRRVVEVLDRVDSSSRSEGSHSSPAFRP